MNDRYDTVVVYNPGGTTYNVQLPPGTWTAGRPSWVRVPCEAVRVARGRRMTPLVDAGGVRARPRRAYRAMLGDGGADELTSGEADMAKGDIEVHHEGGQRHVRQSGQQRSGPHPGRPGGAG